MINADDDAKLMQWIVTNREYIINNWDYYLREALGINRNIQLTDEVILEAIRNIYQRSEDKNLAFIDFTFDLGGEHKQKGFMFAYSGDQFIPGFYYSKERGSYKYLVDYFSEYTKEFEDLIVDFPRWSDSERKLLLTLISLFDINNIEHGEIRMVSEIPFCPSCQKIIELFIDKFSERVDISIITENTLYISW